MGISASMPQAAPQEIGSYIYECCNYAEVEKICYCKSQLVDFSVLPRSHSAAKTFVLVRGSTPWLDRFLECRLTIDPPIGATHRRFRISGKLLGTSDRVIRGGQQICHS